MTRGKRNWTFRQVQTFLRAHGFFLHHIRGSHHYFRGAYNGKLRMAHVQYHGAGSIHPKTLGSIIKQSGIPADEWIDNTT